MADKTQQDTPDPSKMTDQERFNNQVSAAQKARSAQQAAKGWKDKAAACLDPKERYKMLQNAYDHEVEAHGHSKYARRLQSGPWQGGAAGAGIGAGVGAGLGTIVGTLVGGLVSVPTAAVGTLTGIAVGGIHGPFFHLDNHKKSDEQKHQEVMDEAQKLDQAVEEGQREPVPPKQEGEGGTERRKPRKLDNRSGSMSGGSGSEVPHAQAAPAERKKPRKIQVRSQQQAAESAA